MGKNFLLTVLIVVLTSTIFLGEGIYPEYSSHLSAEGNNQVNAASGLWVISEPYDLSVFILKAPERFLSSSSSRPLSPSPERLLSSYPERILSSSFRPLSTYTERMLSSSPIRELSGSLERIL